jgi:hypothetical protein
MCRRKATEAKDGDRGDYELVSEINGEAFIRHVTDILIPGHNKCFSTYKKNTYYYTVTISIQTYVCTAPRDTN